MRNIFKVLKSDEALEMLRHRKVLSERQQGALLRSISSIFSSVENMQTSARYSVLCFPQRKVP